MNLGTRIIKAYFNFVYNPVYDFTTGRFSLYHKLQERCVSKLELEANDKVLCVGLGTGNEVSHVLEMNRNVSIVGVDYSDTALRKARKKALALGKEIEVLTMDAQLLQLPTGGFDKALCIHVMDFVEEKEKVTDEILRVLKDGGQFVITYPSDKEGLRLGVNIFSDSIRHGTNSGRHRITSFLQVLTQMLVGLVYLPLLFRPERKSYSRSGLETMIARLKSGAFQIEENPAYQDFIVYGRKTNEGG